MTLLVTLWMESNIAFFTKVQGGFLTWGTLPLLSLAYPVIDCVISNFITYFRQLSCRGEDICCCWILKTSIVYINNTSPKSQEIQLAFSLRALLLTVQLICIQTKTGNWRPPFLATLTYHVRADVLIETINFSHTFIYRKILWGWSISTLPF